MSADERVIVNGFLFDDFSVDANGNGRPDSVDMAENQFVFLSPSTTRGDGVVEVGEDCDDGDDNGTTPCGCQETCEFPPVGTVCADGGACAADSLCDGAGLCEAGEPVSDGTLCGADPGIDCLTPAVCHSGRCLPAGFAEAGTPCGDPGCVGVRRL